MFWRILADDLTAKSYIQDMKSLIFLGASVILVIVAVIWWLRR